MKIAVCVKQVPDTNDVKWSKENNIIREGLINIINPYDEYAISTALEIKKLVQGAEITLFSMGPNCAKDVLEYGLALGADEACHLCDKRFSGSDTSATSKALAAAIKNVGGEEGFNIIITGQFAIDGDTAQTGPSVANHLGLPVLTYVKKILDVDEGEITARLDLEDEVITAKTYMPCVLCVLKNSNEIKKPKIEDYIRAQKKEIKILNLDDINLSANETGIKGSPTFVQRAYRPEINRHCKMVEHDFAKEILSHIRKENGKKEEIQQTE